MATLRERNRARTRRDIEAAALDLFERQGYDSTTVDQISSTAGVSNATFFRYFGSKEELLFTEEPNAATALIQCVESREDQSHTVAALAEPIARYAREALDDPGVTSQRMTRLVMTTRTLESRSMRMRLRWERALARRLAEEQGRSEADMNDMLVAGIAIMCLATALWDWQRPETDSTMYDTVITTFARCVELGS